MNNFREIEGEAGQNIFKFVALKKIQKSTNIQEKIELSKKYQVLCDETAMVGVIEQENMPMLIVETEEIKFNRPAKEAPG